MIDRRKFINTLGASVFLGGVPPIAASAGEPPPNSRLRLSLNGEWEQRIDGKFYRRAIVPSSCRPSGIYRLNRRFALPRVGPGDRIFVHFEGITYWGQVSINGKKLGAMDPYIPHEFEVTEAAKDGDNEIEVLIADLVPLADGTAKAQIEFGIHPGFEAYGGIIRDVWVEVRSPSFIANVRLAYDLKKEYTACAVRPTLIVSSTENTLAHLEIALYRNQAEVARRNLTKRITPGLTEVELTFDLEEVSLWSPETPSLYELTAHLKTETSDDSWSCRTGFREIRAVGREFRLNGNRLVLNGVCRHDMWKDQGFTLSRQQQEQDMQLIKELGGNFVRLVHYPHDRRIVELADELGLLVSEEPGFWQANFQALSRPAIEVGFRILEALIQRDCNSPSVMIWFLSNECTLTEEFLREGKQRCNRLDPIQRLVSAANDKPADKVKPLFVAAEMDFFDQHEYTFELDEMNQEAKFDGPSKPLTFSEWGGKSVGQAQPIMGQSVDRLSALVESGDLSGHMFWSWQDVRQYSRIDGEMRDGVLESGVVTEARDPREVVWAELFRLFAGQKHGSPEADVDRSRLTVLPLRSNPFASRGTFHNVDLQSLADSEIAMQSWASLEAALEKYWASSPAEDQWKRMGSHFALWQRSELKIAGVLFRCPLVSGRVRPIVLTPEYPEVVIPIHRTCTRLHILGQVSFPLGFPLIGQAGQSAALYSLQYASGKTQPLPVRHGIEVAQANCIDGATRIAPTAAAAQAAVEYVRDAAREQYQALLWSISAQPEEIAGLHCHLEPAQPAIAIFAITLEQSTE
jgi:hypothetical protein